MRSKIINYSCLIAGAIVSLTFLVLFIMSCAVEVYPDDGGSEFFANGDYLVYMLTGIALLVPAIEGVMGKKVCEHYLVSATVIGSLLGLYPLGVFFKALSKAMVKGKPFDFAGNLQYLLVGIFGLIILGVAIYGLVKKQGCKVED